MKRRNFLQAIGLASLALMSTACEQAPWLVGQANMPTTKIINWNNSSQEKLAMHLLKRLTYGANSQDLEIALDKGIKIFIDEQLSPETIIDKRADWLIRRIDTINLKAPDIFALTAKQAISDLRQATILRAVYSNRQLQEVMVEFWSDHFNIYSEKADCAWLKVIDDREIIRKHALGKFSDLLKASATSPAMLSYLDGSNNTINKINENYARELLELHTLGVNSGYSQTDVIEAAKALTGWKNKKTFWRGKVELETSQHDFSAKTILEKTFNANSSSDLEELIDLVSHHPSTACFISKKLCQRFVGEKFSQELVLEVAKRFQESNGDIKETLRVLFNSQEFLNAPPKFKRPFTYAISVLRAINADCDGSQILQDHLENMGQLPFNWPTPDGYPDKEQHWQSYLLPRWNFAIAAANNQIKGTTVDLDSFAVNPAALATNLVQRQLTDMEMSALHQANNVNDMVGLLLCLPEFQYQ